MIKTRSSSKTPVKDQLQEIRTYLEKEQNIALRLVEFNEEISKAQTNFGAVNSFDSDKKTQHQGKERSNHDYYKSGSCSTEWGSLGCVLLYQLATVEERREFIRKKVSCFMCGRSRRKTSKSHTQTQQGKWACKPNNVTLCSPVRCKSQNCTLGAAVCTNHSPNNAKQELLDWFMKIQIKSSVTAVISSPGSSTALSNSASLPPNKTKFTKKERAKLQDGDMCVPFSNEQLKDFFVKDLKSKGYTATKENVIPVPEGKLLSFSVR